MSNNIVNMECSCIQVYAMRDGKKYNNGYIHQIFEDEGIYDCLVTLSSGRLILYWPTGRSVEDEDRFTTILERLIDDCSDVNLVFERRDVTGNFIIYNKDGIEYAKEAYIKR